MKAPEVLKACAEQAKLPFIVIGGFAVIAHGYQRNTQDLDILVRRRESEAWTQALKRVNYNLVYAQQNFAQYKSSCGDMDLDLMYVTDDTFDGMFAAATPTQFQGVPVRVPSLDHLIALKLHVMKQELKYRTLYDGDDIVNLVLENKVNLREPKWRAVFEKYGTSELYEKFKQLTEP